MPEPLPQVLQQSDGLMLTSDLIETLILVATVVGAVFALYFDTRSQRKELQYSRYVQTSVAYVELEKINATGSRIQGNS